MSAADMITLALLVGLVSIFCDIAAGGDTWQIKQENEVSHRWGARLRGVALALPVVAYYVPRVHVDSLAGLLPVLPLLVLKMAVLWLLLLVEFWLLFDLRINKRWGKAWDYIGGTASIDTLGGKFLGKFKYPGRVYVLIKVTAFVVLTVGNVIVNAK
jgi:hypothetical protein